MANGATYPVVISDDNQQDRLGGFLTFTDANNQPSGANPIGSGALPNLGAWVSGTAKVNPVSRQITVAVEIVGDGTNNAATCVVAVSPDGTTFTTLGTPGSVAAVNNTGVITQLVPVTLPEGWSIKLTFAHCTVAASVYF